MIKISNNSKVSCFSSLILSTKDLIIFYYSYSIGDPSPYSLFLCHNNLTNSYEDSEKLDISKIFITISYIVFGNNSNKMRWFPLLNKEFESSSEFTLFRKTSSLLNLNISTKSEISKLCSFSYSHNKGYSNTYVNWAFKFFYSRFSMSKCTDLTLNHWFKEIINCRYFSYGFNWGKYSRILMSSYIKISKSSDCLIK